MKQITLTFKMNKGLVGMEVEITEDNPTQEESVVSSQMVEHIVNARLRSPTIVMASGKTAKEAKQRTNVARDIYLSGRD